MRRKKQNPYTAVVIGLAAIAIALVVLILIRAIGGVSTDGKDGLLGDSGETIDFQGTFQNSDGSAAEVSTVSFQGMTKSGETFQGTGDASGKFEISGMQYNLSYLMTLTDAAGKQHTAVVTFYKDTTTAFGNLADGMEFAVANSGNKVSAVITWNENGYLQCVSCS